MVECGVCGGSVVQTWSARKPAYCCGYNHSRGRAVCSNSLVVDMHLADAAVLQAITRDVLDPEVVGEALDIALRNLEHPATASAERTDTLKNEIARLEAELSRYAEAIADAGPLTTILQAVKVREQRREAIRRELKTIATPRAVRTRDASEIRVELVQYLENWRDMARQVSPRRGASYVRFSWVASSSRP
jgi:Recombinase zinc beta ribbon domain